MRRSPPPPADAFLPTTSAEIRALGWDAPDVVLVSGDAYIDHPSFAAAILGRWLQANGFPVAILAQPDWKSAEPWRALGRPRLFYGVSARNFKINKGEVDDLDSLLPSLMYFVVLLYEGHEAASQELAPAVG